MDEKAIRSCIKRMVAAKATMNAARNELTDFRREARSDGLNVQALNPLVDILSEHQHDGGSRVLNDLAYYALVAGTNLSLSDNRPLAITSSQRALSQQTGAVSELTAFGADSTARLKLPHRHISPSFRLAFDGLLAGCVSVFLIWILH